MKKQNVVFKAYTMAQPSLLPPNLEELILEDHLVRVVDRVVEAINLDPLFAKYKGGGTSSYHPRMMLKVLVYVYSEKVFTSRRIEKGLHENVNFMWLAGGNRPDFRTINRFRGVVMKGEVREVFTGVLELLIEEGYVKMENYFVDGTKIGADANPYKVVWAKKAANNKTHLREKIKVLLDEIEKVNDQENEVYGDDDLEELGGKGGIDAEKLKAKVAELNERLRQEPEDKPLKKAVKTLEKDYLPRLEKYEKQEKTLQSRSSYSQTDPDASCMSMKEDRWAQKSWPHPAYNVQIGTEGQFVVGYSVHQRAGDISCFIPHMEQQHWPGGKKPRAAIADAAYGGEENYAYLEKNQMQNYLKYNTFYQETHPPRNAERIQKLRFRSENFAYDADQDTFTCPAHQSMTYRESRSYPSENGYISLRRSYQCDNCATCPLKPQCTKAKGNRSIQVSFKLREHRRQAKDNLLSEQGTSLRKQRAIEPESTFGDVKYNMGFRRFHLRGFEKVQTEWALICIAHNLRKLAII